MSEDTATTPRLGSTHRKGNHVSTLRCRGNTASVQERQERPERLNQTQTTGQQHGRERTRGHKNN